MKTVEIKKYIADDGKEFETESECFEYEENCSKAAVMLRDMSYSFVSHEDIFPSGNPHEFELFVKIKNEEDSRKFKQWIKSIWSECPFEDKYIIGKTYMINTYCGFESPTLEDVDAVAAVYGCRTVAEAIGEIANAFIHYADMV